ncbi:MAG: GMC family oxidoreductase [Acidobacteriaceae bacterium]|nr:GMC family oxidoreductase [Acidobacteriaceae bacterium]
MKPASEGVLYDVAVIGSGPAGGVLSKELAESGAKVVLIEAGRLHTYKDFHFHSWPYDFPKRAKPRVGYPKEVVDSIRYEDSDNVSMDRIRAVGGRSIHWNAGCFRFAEWDFRERSLEGVEDDWPISYQQIAPYYSYVEKMIGVTGSREGLAVLPDGEFLPPLKMRCSDLIVKRACDKMGIPFIPTRKALLTEAYDHRPACHYCGHCMEGCDVGAIFSVPAAMLPKARKTGNFTLLQNQLAREILVNSDGTARAVSVIDTVTRNVSEIRARRFAVCCGAIESARLLLNSRSPQYPNGLTNSSDLVGRYLHGHVTASFISYLEELIGTKPINNDGALDHTYIPRFNMDKKSRNYVGGFQFQNQFNGFRYPHQAQYLKGFGSDFKRQVRELQPALFHTGLFGKVLARPENRVTVDAGRPDAYGIPIPVVRFRFGENDLALWKDMKVKAQEILHTANARFVFDTSKVPSGFASHEVGTVRMGSNPKRSVLNPFCQAHDVKNLYVVDGSSFVTFPEKNPTHTIMALAVRAARYMSKEAKGLDSTNL